VDVVFEEMEELVAYKVDGAVLRLLAAKVEFERSACFVAGRKGDVLELACRVGDVLAFTGWY